MTLSPDTYTVSQLGRELDFLLGETYRSVWVVGEVQRLKKHRNGHVYFELIEKGHGDRVIGVIDAVIWRKDFERISRTLESDDVALRDGVTLRCRGNLGYWFGGGRLQFQVRELDTVFALGALERRRRATLSYLEQHDLLEANGRLELSALPFQLALVGSPSSAGVVDFVESLRASGYRFSLQRYEASVQGARSEAELVGALRRAVRDHARQLAGGRDPFDAIVLVRGGGAKADLAAFDGRRLAVEIARCPLPVVCGLGHQIDQTIADVVSHTSVKTPTAAAEFLSQRIAQSELRLNDAQARLSRALEGPMRASQERLNVALRRLRAVGTSLERVRSELDVLVRRLGGQSGHVVERARSRAQSLSQRLVSPSRRAVSERARRLAERARRIAPASRRIVEGAERTLLERQRLCEQLAPERILERGFSLTRTQDGRVLRDAAQIAEGALLETQLSDGTVSSRVVAATKPTDETRS